MAVNLPPIPQDKISEVQSWRDWFRTLSTYVQQNNNNGGGGTISGVVTIAEGGTGATTASQARTNLGIKTGITEITSVDNSVIVTQAGTIVDLSVAGGGMAVSEFAETPTDYYYGGLVGTNWKINRYALPDMTKTSATMANNPSYTSLSAAWATYTTLVYS